MPTRSSFTLIGFLICAFAVVGLTGVFATYAIPIPYQRAVARQAALDAAQMAAAGADPAAALAALGPRLADSAAALAGGGDLAARIAAERIAVQQRFTREAAATERQLRLLIIVITAAAAAFGAAMLGIAMRRR